MKKDPGKSKPESDHSLSFSLKERRVFDHYFKVQSISQFRSQYYPYVILLLNLLIIFLTTVKYDVFFVGLAIQKSDVSRYWIICLILITLGYLSAVGFMLSQGTDLCKN